MHNCHSKLYAFYDDQVRLKEKSKTLREYRDRNLDRVRDGTKKLREKEQAEHPLFADDISQGSMAMFTTNQAQNDDDHDIDHALIYDEAEALDDPAEMRRFVARAINESPGNFSREPEARTNAVTVWYINGYHVDFAIYKRKVDVMGRFTYYHAGEEWSQRDPRAITDWFNASVTTLSPRQDDWGVEVAKNQLRRIVRLIKYWTKSRAKWSLPSGLVLSTLAVECYRKNTTRDDLALIDTLNAISSRLSWNTDVSNPTDASISLLTTEEHRKQISSLKEKIDQHVGTLKHALGADSGDEKAWRAWGTFFNHNWWDRSLNKSEARLMNSRMDGTDFVDVEVVSFKRPGSRRIKYDPQGHQIIVKGMNIKFTAKPNVPSPYTVRWTVQNVGDEASWQGQDKPRAGQVDKQNQLVCHETSAFRGNHLMICEVSTLGRTYRKDIPIRIR